MTALAAGVPQVVLPLFAYDQLVNAGRVAGAGAGLQVLGGLDEVQQLPDAVEQVLHDAGCASGARTVAAAIAALPDVTDAPTVLEALVAARTE
jgi:UDP:flavonoid glycosyltransferase YjiC (YdhE family)